MISRRNLLKLGIGSAALCATGLDRSVAWASPSGRKIPIGLQLYSVRHACEKDLPPVLEAVAKMGYEGVEFAGYYGRTAEQLAKLLQQNGLKCCGTHIPLSALTGDALQSTIEFNQTLGNKFLIVSWMPPAELKTVEAIKATAKKYDEIAAKLKPLGMVTGYHAHGGDFAKVDGRPIWDIFFESTCADVAMQLDIGNCIDGGGDPYATLRRFPGRSATVHLKEHGGTPEAVVGEGTVDWKQVLEFCEASGGTQWYIVEHERPAGDPLANVARCLQNLKKLGR